MSVDYETILETDELRIDSSRKKWDTYEGAPITVPYDYCTHCEEYGYTQSWRLIPEGWFATIVEALAIGTPTGMFYPLLDYRKELIEFCTNCGYRTDFHEVEQ